MSFFNKLFGKSEPYPNVEAQNTISAHLRDLSPNEQQLVARTMVGALELLQNLTKTPVPNALPTGSFSAPQYLRFYKIVFAYYWMMLFIHDRHAKSSMRRLLTKITDQNQADTDRLCDDIEVVFVPNDPDDPRFALGKVAWSKIRASVPTNKTSDTMVHMTFAMVFDNFRDSVAHLFS